MAQALAVDRSTAVRLDRIRVLRQAGAVVAHQRRDVGQFRVEEETEG
ncbi:hypothetical protein ACFU99_00920 [Streptomyces sp. NPDC057654]